MSIPIQDLQDGVLYWECNQSGNYQFRAIGKPFRHMGGWGIVARFTNIPKAILYKSDKSPFSLPAIYDQPVYTGVRTMYLREDEDESTRAVKGT